VFGYCIVVSLTAFSVICYKTFYKVYTLLSHTHNHTKSPLGSRGRDNGELSITEHSHMQTRHSFLVYNMADRSNRRHGDTLKHAVVWSSAKPTPHSTILRSPTNIHVHQLCLHLTLPNNHTDVFKLRHTVTPKISPVTRHRTYNNKHNETINLHDQSCCTHKLHTQTHPKISQNVYKSKRNLVANYVQVSHT